jgi:hypothetical protein
MQLATATSFYILRNSSFTKEAIAKTSAKQSVYKILNVIVLFVVTVFKV